jgi:hypothetical protein
MKYLSLLLVLLLNSCNGIPPAKRIDIERCFLTIDKEVSINDTNYYSGACICHNYRVGDELKRTSESKEKPLNYCNKQATFIDYPTTLYIFLESWRVYLLQQ